MLDLALLAATILCPTLTTFWLVIRKLGEGHDLNTKARSVFELNTEHGLIKQGLLWLAIGIPLSLGFAFGLWTWSGYEVSLTPEGYKKFAEISLLPLALMSMSLPLAALVARFHSTQQSARQIVLSRTKNNLDAYYAHRKAMFEYFKEIDDTKYFNQYTFSYKTHPVIHKRFFIGTPEDGTPAAHKHAFEQTERFILSAANLLSGVLDGSNNNSFSFYLAASTDIYHAARKLNIKKIYMTMREQGVHVRYDDDSDAPTFGTSTLETLAALRFTLEYYNNLCDFSGRDRMDIPADLEAVFTKTEFWLNKGKFIEALHEGPIAQLVASGSASLGELHYTLEPGYVGPR
ncbi:hypothetical protein K4A76_14600 [Pseudomonas sp. NEEL19]|uniref:hypothetical protein n=1 Tax=Pseudomonas sp. NEEL19 TaxID=2867409 RepID=UPI0023676CB5|nr:hypothetical protein [Pseudomonas sp. NEEL19]WDM57703.1 hypothetical protein K4A76_14600 [Pseudomonas sp. NEEL19]